MKYSEYTAVIIGSGAAGLYAALKISSGINLPDGILLVTKSSLGASNSMYAQGGIAGVIHQNPADNAELHAADTLKAGAGLCDREAAEEILGAADEVISDLMHLGVDFDKKNDGGLNFTLEGAHSIRRILHSGGDATGKGITKALCRKVMEDPNITVQENSLAVELLINYNGECKGAIVYNTLTEEYEIISTSALVLATGGAGQIYKYTTNPKGASGSGIDLAYHAGALIRDMEFMQFHPTALAISPDSKNRFLISEAVRGEGAKLVNGSGEEFMARYHDRLELAPRDVVTRAIFREMEKEKSHSVFLNASVIDPLKLAERFPTISKVCLNNGIDISKEPIPVAPAAHYTMGGIKASVEGKTSVKGLYAIGECASTGLHGANRLASNSLLECVVCAYELADFLSFSNLIVPKKIDERIRKTIAIYSEPISGIDYDTDSLKKYLKDIMWENVGIIRSQKSLKSAEEEVGKLKNEFKRTRKCLNQEEYEYRSMLTVSSLIIRSALLRKESRGAHCREDYPQTDETVVHTDISKTQDTEPVYAE